MHKRYFAFGPNSVEKQSGAGRNAPLPRLTVRPKMGYHKAKH